MAYNNKKKNFFFKILILNFIFRGLIWIIKVLIQLEINEYTFKLKKERMG